MATTESIQITTNSTITTDIPEANVMLQVFVIMFVVLLFVGVVCCFFMFASRGAMGRKVIDCLDDCFSSLKSALCQRRDSDPPVQEPQTRLERTDVSTNIDLSDITFPSSPSSGTEPSAPPIDRGDLPPPSYESVMTGGVSANSNFEIPPPSYKDVTW